MKNVSTHAIVQKMLIVHQEITGEYAHAFLDIQVTHTEYEVLQYHPHQTQVAKEIANAQAKKPA